MRLVFATTNPGKLRELRELARGLPLEILSLAEVGARLEVEESGSTFAKNACLKALALATALKEWALADDSGLCVDALGGEPGVRSARYSGGGDAENVRKLLKELDGVPAQRRTAHFQSALCLASPAGEITVVEGRCEGRIAAAPRGSGGFGYDPVFEIPELGLTFAELPAEEKNRRSHRGQAMRDLRPVLEKLSRALEKPGAPG